jgi:hypothetical protein
MSQKAMRFLVAILVLITAVAACAPKNEDKTGQDVDAVAIDIQVDHDNYFGISNNTVVGDIWFSDSVGLVGTPVTMVVEFLPEYYKRMQETTIFGIVTLMNPDITKIGEYDFEFTIDERRTEFEIIVEQVKSVPAILDYTVSLTAVNPDDENEYFESTVEYQFLVNQGTPAT